MSRQDRATTERNSRTLRELVKRPENKVCADCKRNDPRWASWNLGVFLCIRCSGIHRSMGTHISKVKSVDLDMWTAEQMESVQRWGNHLANLYWEAHLKPGHIPPEHKIESFVRSKYESRRWAMEGPLPANPSDLANADASSTMLTTANAGSPTPPTSASAVSNTANPSSTSTRATGSTRPSEVHQLLSSHRNNQSPSSTAQHGTRAPQGASRNPPAPAPAPAPVNDLFSLDFNNAPAQPITSSQASEEPVSAKKDVKNDILSLFSSSTPAAAPVWSSNPQRSQPTGMLGDQGTGMWGVSSGWNEPASHPASTQGNLWHNQPGPAAASTAPSQSLFSGSDVWATSSSASAGKSGANADLFSTNSSTQNDAFGDIWSGFK